METQVAVRLRNLEDRVKALEEMLAQIGASDFLKGTELNRWANNPHRIVNIHNQGV